MESTENNDDDKGDLVSRSMKNVKIKEKEEDRGADMDTNPIARETLSWRDRLVGTSLLADERATNLDGLDGEEDFELLKEDVERSPVNGIPLIKFLERVNQILIKHMEYTVVIKLLGRNI